MKRIAIIGAGSWGTALAVIAARAGHEVQLWSRNREAVSAINGHHLNPFYLTSAQIPPDVKATSEIETALKDAALVIFAAPSHAARELLTLLGPHLNDSAIVVSVAKGIEIETGKRISEIFKEVAGATHPFVCPFVCLSGPSFA